MGGKVATFDLAKNIESEEYNINSQEVHTDSSSIEKIHLNNHSKASKEVTHSIDSLSALDFSIPEMEDDELWNEIEFAVLENDITNLRANLQNISKTIDLIISDIEIDQYIDSDLEEDLTINIEAISKSNLLVENNIQLHHEINEAIGESDVMDLRSSLANIMQDESDQDAKIDNFLLNSMDEFERNIFENSLSSNECLLKALKLNTEINDAILEDDVIRLRSNLKNISAEQNESKNHLRVINPNNKRIIRRFSTIAAAIAIGFILYNPKPINVDDLYETNYQPYDAIGFVRSASATMDMASYGVDLYNYKEYKRAINVFANVLDETPEQPLANFYAGLSYQQLENYSTAISYYDKVISNFDNLFVEQAEWYKALCLLKTEQNEAGVKLIHKIANSKSYYQQKAKTLLNKIK